MAVDISTTVIDNMLRDAQVVAAFPFLAQYSENRKAIDIAIGDAPCTGCKRKKLVKKYPIDYNAIKTAFVNAPASTKLKLKKMLNASQVRICYKNSNGKTISVKFS